MLALGGAARRDAGWTLGWPGWGVALALGAAVTVLALRSVQGQGRVFLGLSVAVLPLLIGLPLGGVRALSGAPLLALVVAALLLRRAKPWSGRMFLPLMLVVYAGVALRVQSSVGAEGDEPHYLMVAESLLRDADVALDRDYAEGRYKAFYRSQPTLEPHYLVRGRHGEIYSQHGLGLSLLVLPAYALGGYPGASIFMALLSALLAVEMRTLLRAWLSAGLADGVAWIVALCPPLVHFAGLVFTEVPAALAFAFALNRLRRPGDLTVWRALAVGAVLGFMPWLNVRYLPFPLILLVYAAWARPRARVLAALALPLLASALAIGLYHFALYGFFDPRLVYGRRPGFAWGRLPGSLEALFFDQEFGLWVYAPVFALALPGFVFLWRRAGARELFAVAAPTLAVLITAATWRMWWGGFTPPARFLVPVAPALAVGVACALRRGIGARAALLIGWSLFLGLAGAWQPYLIHRDRDGTAPLLRAYAGAEEWTRLFPSFVVPEADPAKHTLVLIWGSALALAIWPRRGRRRPGPGQLGPAVGGWLLAASVASYASVARTGGRDAVRTVGRPAVLVPGLVPTRSATATWDLGDLDWGPTFEAHRFPVGADVGSRLPLPAGVYRFTIFHEDVPGAAPAQLTLVREPGGSSERLEAACDHRHCVALFTVSPEDRAITLRLTGGGPLVVERFELDRADPSQPLAAEAGPRQ